MTGNIRLHANWNSTKRRIMAVLAVVLTLSVLFAPVATFEDVDATPDDIYRYTISTSIKVTDIDGNVTSPIGKNPNNGSESFNSVGNAYSGSWTWNVETGYGPFNSFYAAFDVNDDNRMICHLDPFDLSYSVDHSISLLTTEWNSKPINIMWCLPTVYWYTSGSSLVLTNDPDSVVENGAQAYAHTIYSDEYPDGHTYEYLAIGVYEATSAGSSSSAILTSESDSLPLGGKSVTVYQEYAQRNDIDTIGGGLNGYANVWNFYQYELYKYCALATMSSWDSQSVVGFGAYYNSSSNTTTGNFDLEGPYCGRYGSGGDVKLFIESPWYSLCELVCGISYTSGSIYIDQRAVPERGMSDEKIVPGVTKVNVSLPWCSTIAYGSNPSTNVHVWGLPTGANGSKTSGTYDGIWLASGFSDFCVGGASRRGGYEPGINYISSYTGSNDETYGTRLAFVFDDDLVTPQYVTYNHGALGAAGVDPSGLIQSIQIMDGNTTYTDLGSVDGYEHAGWYVDGSFYAPDAKVAVIQSHTAYSVWQPATVSVRFMVEGANYATLIVPKGSTGVVFTPENVSGIFTGWFYDPSFLDEYDPLQPLDSDICLYAKGVPPLTFTTDPVADGYIEAISGEPGTVSFSATSSRDYHSVLWDFGDGTTSTDLYAKHYYDRPGTYYATLTVFNNHGSDVVEYLVQVPSADTGDDRTEWALVLAAVLAVAVVGALIARRFV